MAEEAIHTRDMDVSAHHILKHYPNKKKQVQQAFDFIQSPTDSKHVILDFLDSFGTWILNECDKWLDKNNPERDIEYQFESVDNDY